MFRIRFKPSADRQLRRLPADVQRRLVTATESLTDDPRPPGAVKLAEEENLWRIRVGQCRVVYAIKDDELLILVVRVAHRKDAYRGM